MEENILRKANQKRLLDSVVIQAGAFTTDFLRGGADGLRELFGPGAAAEPAAPPAPPEPSPRGRGGGRKGRGGRGGKAAKAAAAAAASEARVAPSPEPSAAELEAAMLCAQDAEDVAALQQEQEAAANEAAEFDETIPFREEVDGAESEARTGADTALSAPSGNESDMPPPSARRPRRAAAASSAGEGSSAGGAATFAVAIADAEDAADFAEAAGGGIPGGGAVLSQLEGALTPVQLYMLRVLEEEQEVQAAQAERELQWEEWEMDRLARVREEEERLADEEDEVLFYAVTQPQLNGEPKKRGRAANGVTAPSYLSNVAAYLQQQAARSGLERSDELASLEMRLWGPPALPDRDADEPYAPLLPLSSDGEAGRAGEEEKEEEDPMAILPAGTFHTLQFSSLVTEGVQGLQRVRQQVSERRARAREAGGGGGRRDRRASDEGGSGRASGRARKATRKAGGEEEGEEDESLLEALPASEPPPGLREGKRSHKKRRVGEPAAAAAALVKSSRGKAAGAAAKKEMPRPSPEAAWSGEEDAALLRAVHAHGSSNWELVSETVSLLAPQRYRSSRSCHDRCAHVLLPRDDGHPREPGAALDGVPPAAPGSLAALPTPALLDTEAVPLRAGAPPGVGSSMREREAARANALQPAALQAETTQQVKLFALLTKLVHTAHLIEAQHMARLAAQAAAPHPSQARLAARALGEGAISQAASSSPRPPSPRSLAPLVAGSSPSPAPPVGLQGLRLASGGDPFMKPFTPAQPRQVQAAARGTAAQAKAGAAAAGGGAGPAKAKAPAQRRPSAKAAGGGGGTAGWAAGAPAAKGKSRSKKAAAPKDEAAGSSSAAGTSGAPAAAAASATAQASGGGSAGGGSVGVTAAAAASLPAAQPVNRAAAPQRQLPTHQMPPSVASPAAGALPAARAQGDVRSPQQRVLAPPAPPRPAGEAGSPAGAPCFGGQPCGVPSSSSAPALPSLAVGSSPSAAGGSGGGGTPRFAQKGLPMNVLLEVIQQYPALKSHIHEIVSRTDYSEADKMAHIKRIIREAKPPGQPPQ